MRLKGRFLFMKIENKKQDMCSIFQQTKIT